MVNIVPTYDSKQVDRFFSDLFGIKKERYEVVNAILLDPTSSDAFLALVGDFGGCYYYQQTPVIMYQMENEIRSNIDVLD